MASIEKRGDTYRIKVFIGYDSHGKKITRSATFKPERTTATGKPKAESVIQKELTAFAAEFERKAKAGELLSGDNMRLDELIPQYLEQYAFMELSQATAEGYREILDKCIIPEFGHIKLCDLSRQQLSLQAYFNGLTKSGLAPSTVRRHMAILSSVLSWAVNMRLMQQNPLSHVRPPKEQRKQDKAKSFTPEELKRFIAALELPQIATYKAHKCARANGSIYSVQEYKETRYLSEQFKFFFILAAFSGCRRGELIALDWPDIDFKRCTISITKSVTKIKGGVAIKDTKTASGNRIINMPPSVMAIASKWRIQQNELRLSLGSAWKGVNNVFSQAEGGRMHPDTVTRKFRDIIQNYNAQADEADRLPEISLHGLRHTAASILIGQHTDIATVSKRLGHSRTSVTLDIYTHAIKEADKAAAEALDALARSAGIG